MKAYNMLVMDGRIPLSSVIMNNIDLLKSYINNNHLGDLTVNIHPNKLNGVLTFIPANESINLSGVRMYMDSLINEITMDNGASYFIGNETSAYDVSQCRDVISRIFPEVLPTVDSIIADDVLPSDTAKNSIVNFQRDNTSLNSVDNFGLESETAPYILPEKKTVITNEMLYNFLVDMKSTLDSMKTTLDTLVDDKATSSEDMTKSIAEEVSAIIKETNIDPMTAEPGAEVATPATASVPDGNMNPPVQNQTSNKDVEEVKTTPIANTDVLTNEKIDATTPTSGMENATYPDGDLGDIMKYVDSLKSILPGIESEDMQTAENLINNYIISNATSEKVPSNIIRLFTEYSFIESSRNQILEPLDRVTQVRRQLSTNKYI